MAAIIIELGLILSSSPYLRSAKGRLPFLRGLKYFLLLDIHSCPAFWIGTFNFSFCFHFLWQDRRRLLLFNDFLQYCSWHYHKFHRPSFKHMKSLLRLSLHFLKKVSPATWCLVFQDLIDLFITNKPNFLSLLEENLSTVLLPLVFLLYIYAFCMVVHWELSKSRLYFLFSL